MFNLQPLELTWNLQETEGLDEKVKPHQEKTMGQSHVTGQITSFFFNKPKAPMEMGEDSTAAGKLNQISVLTIF